MKSVTLTAFIVSLLGMNVSNASNLCDAACSITISFPTGGSIVAVETATITFGDGGLVDTVDTVTAYLSGDTILLNAGESLEFGSGGSFDIGDMGNIDYTNISITTSGDISIEATSGIGQIGTTEGGTLSIVADGHTTITGSLIIISGLIKSEFITIESTGDLIFVDNDPVSNDPVNCEIPVPAEITVSATISNGITIDSTDRCDTINNILTPSIIQTGGSGSVAINTPDPVVSETSLDLSEQITSFNKTIESTGGGGFCLGLIIVILGFKINQAGFRTSESLLRGLLTRLLTS